MKRFEILVKKDNKIIEGPIWTDDYEESQNLLEYLEHIYYGKYIVEFTDHTILYR